MLKLIKHRHLSPQKVVTLLAKNIAIDLGTANTRILSQGKGTLLNQPSVLVVQRGQTEGVPVAVGQDAKSKQGRVPENLQVVTPVRAGVITDFHLSVLMAKTFLQQVLSGKFFKPSLRMAMSVPCDVTQVDRRAIREVGMSLGASDVHLIEAPMAAALGAQLPVQEARASMVMDIGAGTTELAVIALGGVVSKLGVRAAGDDWLEAITQHVRRQYGVSIGEPTAERILLEAGHAHPDHPVTEVDVTGQKLFEGVPRTITLRSTEVHEAMAPTLQQIVDAVKTVLQGLPAEVAADIAEDGITLTGGGAMLPGIDRLLLRATGLKVHIAKDPLTCVVRGCAMAMGHSALLNKVSVRE